MFSRERSPGISLVFINNSINRIHSYARLQSPVIRYFKLQYIFTAIRKIWLPLKADLSIFSLVDGFKQARFSIRKIRNFSFTITFHRLATRTTNAWRYTAERTTQAFLLELHWLRNATIWNTGYLRYKAHSGSVPLTCCFFKQSSNSTDWNSRVKNKVHHVSWCGRSLVDSRTEVRKNFYSSACFSLILYSFICTVVLVLRF